MFSLWFMLIIYLSLNFLEMSKLENSDFNKICRLCLKEDSALINIFFSDAAQIISEITSIKLREGEFLPENICIPCMDKSTEFYNFKQFCEKNNATLRTHSSKYFDPEDHEDNFKTKNDNRSNYSLREASNNSKQHKVKRSKDIYMNVSIPLKTRNKRQSNIKRSYKDLIALENSGNDENFFAVNSDSREKNDVTSNVEVTSQDISSECDNVPISQVRNVDNFHENDDTEEVKEEFESEAEKLQDVSGSDKKFCNYCNVDFENIVLHLEQYHPTGGWHYCYICSKRLSSGYNTVKQLQSHLKHHDKIPRFQCEVCSRWFKFKHQRKAHMRLHSGERSAVCEICAKSFRNPYYLIIHLKSHSGERPYKCTICQKAFVHKYSLKVHMKSHSTMREHMCTVCGKTFMYAHNLKIHFRQHTGEKPYTCRLCLSSFVSCSILTAHMLTHSDKKRFECQECDKKFKRTGDLNIHMRSHTGEKPYACTLCNNRYKMSSHLTEHMKTHTGEKNYICQICSKSFYNNKALRVHNKSHTGEKSFSCQDCDKSFVHYTSLYAHQRKHHKT